MPSVNPELLARLAEEQPDPSAVSAFAQRLVADPAPEVALTEVLAGLPDASVRILSAALAEQLALEASALDDRDASEVLHHAAALYGLTGKGGAGQARCLAEAYTRFPSLGTLNTVDALLGRRDSDSQLAARAQLDSSEEGLKALTTIVERWLDAGRFEHVVELLGSAAEVHGEARELLRGLMEEVNADRAEPEESASDDGASAETTDAALDETLEVQSESPHTAVGEPAQVEERPTYAEVARQPGTARGLRHPRGVERPEQVGQRAASGASRHAVQSLEGVVPGQGGAFLPDVAHRRRRVLPEAQERRQQQAAALFWEVGPRHLRGRERDGLAVGGRRGLQEQRLLQLKLDPAIVQQLLEDRGSQQLGLALERAVEVGLEQRVDVLVVPGLHEELHLGLLELAGPEDEVPGGDLVPEGLPDLRDPERDLLPGGTLDVQEVDKNTLGSFRP